MCDEMVDILAEFEEPAKSFAPPEEGARVYIAGPMSGYPLYNFPMFFTAAMVLRDAGWIVENPAEHDMAMGVDPTKPLKEQKFRVTREDLLTKDFRIIGLSTDVVFLPGWEASEGARAERVVAAYTGRRMWLWTETGLERDDRPLPVISV